MKITAKENGKAVSDLRKKNFLGSSELCKKANISEPTLRNVEKGENTSKLTATKIAGCLDKNIKELFEVK